MSQEVRYIVFDEVDLAAALIGWTRRQGRTDRRGARSRRSGLRRAGAEIEAALRADSRDHAASGSRSKAAN